MKKTRREIILDEIDECDNHMLKIILERDIARIGEDEETHQECMNMIKDEFVNIVRRKEILLQLLDNMTIQDKQDFSGNIIIMN